MWRRTVLPGWQRQCQEMRRTAGAMSRSAFAPPQFLSIFNISHATLDYLYWWKQKIINTKFYWQTHFVILWIEVMKCLIWSEDGVAAEKCDGRAGLRLHSSGSQQARLESTQHYLHLQTHSGWVLLCRYGVMWCGLWWCTAHYIID